MVWGENRGKLLSTVLCLFSTQGKMFYAVICPVHACIMKFYRHTNGIITFSYSWVLHTWNCVSNPVLPVSRSFSFSFLMAPESPEARIWVSPQVRDSKTASWMNTYWSCVGHSHCDSSSCIKILLGPMNLFSFSTQLLFNSWTTK